MKKTSIRAAATALIPALCLTVAAPVSARPRLSLGGYVGPAFALGDSTVRDRGRLGPAVGASLGYRFYKDAAASFNYDRLDLGRTTQAETMTVGLALHSRRDVGRWGTFGEAGFGIGRLDEQDDLNNLALRFGVGLEKLYTDSLSVGMGLHYHYVARGDAPYRYKIHALVPALRVAFQFGGGE